MNKLLSIVVLGSLALAVAGCGDPAPSTPIAPDLPDTGKGAPVDAGASKAAEHAGTAGDRG